MCSIEFENHRPLYEWVVDNCPLPHHPKQREFARLNVTHTVMSKRYLRQLVFEKARRGLGRSAYAYPVRTAPPRLHA